MDQDTTRLILCPTDFSPSSAMALRRAGELASILRGRLLALYADRFLPPPHFTSQQIDRLVQESAQHRQATFASLVQYSREHAGQDAAIECLVKEDLAVPAIVQTAKERDVDLVVMGSHGHTGISRIMLGSVTERVLRMIDRPVLVVRPVRAGGDLPPLLSRVLCPVDFSEGSRRALDLAIQLAAAASGEVCVLHVTEKDAGIDSPADVTAKLKAWLPGNLGTVCLLREETRAGRVAEQIILAAEENHSSLLVLASKHTIFTDTTLLGATVARVSRHAPCPVLTVPVE